MKQTKQQVSCVFPFFSVIMCSMDFLTGLKDTNCPTLCCPFLGYRQREILDLTQWERFITFLMIFGWSESKQLQPQLELSLPIPFFLMLTIMPHCTSIFSPKYMTKKKKKKNLASYVFIFLSVRLSINTIGSVPLQSILDT